MKAKKKEEKKKIECQPGAFLQDHTGLKHFQILQSTRTQIFSLLRVTVGACCFSRMCPNLLCLISLRLAHSREPSVFAPLTLSFVCSHAAGCKQGEPLCKTPGGSPHEAVLRSTLCLTEGGGWILSDLNH